MFEVYRTKGITPRLALDLAKTRAYRPHPVEGWNLVLATIPLSTHDIDFQTRNECPRCNEGLPLLSEVMMMEKEPADNICSTRYCCFSCSSPKSFNVVCRDSPYGCDVCGQEIPLSDERKLYTCDI